MSPAENPTNLVRAGGLLARAQRLGAGAVLAAAAYTQLPAGMTFDYSAVGNYSNSGYFTGVLDDTKTTGAILPGGFKLSGGDTRTDSIFWYYNSYYEQTLPDQYTTGFAFVWGGKLTGGSMAGDTLAAPFQFSLAFTNLLDDPFVSANVRVVLGHRDNPFTPTQYQNDPTSYNGGWHDDKYFNFSTAGSYDVTDSLSVSLPETTNDRYWYAMLSVQWNGESVNPYYWNGQYTKLNGDTFTVTVPDHSIDVTYVPAAPPPPQQVPDSGSTGSLLGLTVMGLLCLHRRR